MSPPASSKAAGLVLLLVAVGVAGIRNEFGFGADYSNQRYSTYTSDTLAADTTDIETEAKTSWRFVLQPDRAGFTASNTAILSTRSLRDALTLRLERPLTERLMMQTGLDADGRWYHDLFPDLTDTLWRKTHVNGMADAGLSYFVTNALRLAASDRLEALLYQEPDSFSYNYVLNRVHAGLSIAVGLLGSFDANWHWSQRNAIGVDSQDYDDHSLRLSFDDYLGDKWQVRVDNDVARRRYLALERSNWSGSPSIDIRLDPGPAFGLSLEDDARWTLPDSATSVYPRQLENRLRPGVEWRPLAELSLRLGLQWERVRTLPEAAPEDYHDLSIPIGVDLLRAGRLWVSLEERFGWRRHDSPDSAYRSNYVYNDLSLMLNWTVISSGRHALVLDGMASIAPEWHATPEDNYYLTNYSLGLKYGF